MRDRLFKEKLFGMCVCSCWVTCTNQTRWDLCMIFIHRHPPLRTTRFFHLFFFLK
jgi:hypothetical protein